MRRVHALLGHNVCKDCFAKRIFGNQNRKGCFGSSCRRSTVDGLTCFIKVEVVK